MRIMTLPVALIAIAPCTLAQAGRQPAREAVTFIKDRQRLPDEAWQSELRHRSAWRQFLAEHGTWYVHFNEENGKPHRAFGRPIATSGANPQERAQQFIQQELDAFGIPVGELELKSVAPTSKHTYIHFGQRHQGLDVLFSRMMVKLNADGRVIGFGADVYDAIDVDVMPFLVDADAAVIASNGLSGVLSTEVQSQLGILPVPAHRGTEFHLVYEVMVHTMNGVLPGHYRCLVDAHGGELLYRHDLVKSHAPPAGADMDLTASVYEFHPFIPEATLPLPHVEVVIGGNTFNTDINGHLASGVIGPVNATIRLQGDWSDVQTNGVTPQFNISLAEGANAVSFDGDANIRERSAYFHVNIVHDHCKTYLPAFTGMDFSLETNVDVAGTCNAFYDGSSINFYMEGGGCQSYAQLGEVVYHEYGHGINDNFYQSLGSFFINGAMNEGYADVWGLSITEDPILAEGSDLVDPSIYIRRYDIDPKVYPVDIVGEVHADGEIIAGAWWDTYVGLGNDMMHTMTLFADAFPGLQAEAPDGDEGTAFRDVLIDVLEADDDDGDITNGTPNGNAIVEAFAIHGITLISNAELTHTPIDQNAYNDPIEVDAELVLAFPFSDYVESVLLRYRLNNDPIWNDVVMTNTGGNDYQGMIPGQPTGTVIPYYLGVIDIFSQVSSVVPIGCDLPEPNIPYFILVNFTLQAAEDCDFNNDLGNWDVGLPTDNASTGQWALDIPTPSYTDGGVIVQTDQQVTPGGELCFLTGNAPAGEGIGVNDVDDGHTTLQSYPIDLTGYDNPTFTFWRWYTNNPPGGANPGMDWWQMDITNNGTNWVHVENTRTSDKSWRRFAFRVQDFVAPTNAVRIRFIASDSTHLGEYLDGGSLIEAAVDDIQLWDNAGSIGIAEMDGVTIAGLYPDPANQAVNVRLDLHGARDADLRILDATGRLVREQDLPASGSGQALTIDVSALAPGSYVMQAAWAGGSSEHRFNIVR